ncbi:MAG: hypothetical protein WA782_19435, partial [Sulfitobacter sp.]
EANTSYTYNISGVDAADVDGGLLTGSVTTDANGDATITVALAADRTTEGEETLTVSLPNTTLTASVTVNDTSLDNTAPAAEDAALAVSEEDAAVTGQLVALDAEGDDVTFALDAAVAGLTVNADGSYTFDPSANPASAALVYTDDPLVIEATYTATDALGAASDPKTLSITVTPTPLTLSLEQSVSTVEEGSVVGYTVVASEALQTALSGTVQIEIAAGDTASLADFGSGSFNTQPVTIAVGETVSNQVTITPTNDSVTETPETFTATATVADFDIASIQTTVQDPSSVGGLGQTFTLTTGVDTMPGLIGSAGSTGTDGDDTIIGTVDAGAGPTNTSTISALDNLNGGLGTDTLKVQVLSEAATIAQTALNGLTLSNVEIVDLASAVALTANTSAFAGVTDVNISNITTGATNVTAGATQDVTLNDTAVGAAVNILAGKDVDVTLTNTTGVANTIGIGATTPVTGAVDVSSTGSAIAGAAATAMGAITTTGGTTVNITQDANSVSGNAATTATGATVVTTGAVTATGGSSTTTVNVSNGDQVAAVAAVAGVTGVQQTQTVTFTALNAGNTVTVNGLTFTATKNLTAAEVAQAFAGLTNVPVTGDRQDDGGPTANGFYTGTHTAATFTTGAAVGNTVTYTEVTAGTNAALAPAAAIGTGTTAPAAPTAAVTTTGVAATAAVTGVAGVANGLVTIDDGGTASIADIMVDGYSAGATLGGGGSLNALQNLSLMNSGAGGNATLTSTSTTLNVVLNDVDGNVTLPATLTNLTLNTQGTASTGGIIAAGATSVIINAAANLTAGAATNFAGATSVDVNGAGRVNLTNNGFANTTALQTFNAADNSGGTTVTLGTANRVEITGGTGNDTVNLTQTTIAAGDNILLGAGNDTLNFTGAGITAGGIAAGVTLSGGEGMMDVLGLLSADAQVVSGSAAFEGFIDGFEILGLGAAGAANTVNLANLDDINHVRYANSAANLQTITNMANNGTLELQGAGGGGTTVQMTDSTGAADSLNIILDDSLVPGGFNAGTVTLSGSATAIGAGNTSGVETINISVDDTFVDLLPAPSGNGIDDTNAAFTLTLAEQTATATTVDIGGAGDLTLNTAAFAAAAPLTTVDGSDMTGVLTYTANNANMTVTGGSGNDMLSVSATADSGTFNGGAGNDTFMVAAGADLVTLNGGTGMDTFDFNGVSTTDSNYAVLSSVDMGDTIDLAGLGVNAFNATQVTLSLGATESTQAFQEAAMNTLATNAAGWFQTGGNTFIVADLDGNATYDAGVDFTVLLTGGVDLSTASFNATSGTIEIA